jgi:hypothetical protein
MRGKYRKKVKGWRRNPPVNSNGEFNYRELNPIYTSLLLSLPGLFQTLYNII